MLCYFSLETPLPQPAFLCLAMYQTGWLQWTTLPECLCHCQVVRCSQGQGSVKARWRKREKWGDLPSPPSFYVLYLEAAVSSHMSATSVCPSSRVPAFTGIWSHYLDPSLPLLPKGGNSFPRLKISGCLNPLQISLTLCSPLQLSH